MKLTSEKIKNLSIVTVVGARPQFVKASAVSRLIDSKPNVDEFIIHTGQHYDHNMSGLFFEELGIRKPDVNLGIESKRHGDQTGRMLSAIECHLIDQKPDWVLVYGDTNSTLAGALAASKLNIPVAHVEAGLRSFNRKMPEEVNRVVTDHLSDLMFAPTIAAVENLRREGRAMEHVINVGDVMYDVALRVAGKAAHQSDILTLNNLRRGTYVLGTVHRAENTDDRSRLEAIVNGVSKAAEHVEIVLPLHPRTRERMRQHGLSLSSNVRIIDPVGYLDMTSLLISASSVFTDSGGVQKEAYFHGVPCLTLRDETEWGELVSLGWNTLLPPVHEDEIAEAIGSIKRPQMSDSKPLVYGNGNTSSLILEHLMTMAAR
ncbi:non-hydrolyzing UDP-N-acetylglucosamine 2-epimerase [Fodinicurvata sp. EGI_FJ10296]|uniref:non-hydrolyzing UDP-N-acetylglucosamine 2-epimerase n=1 Tax=Fodinicurvata sp. EGI_FJ10296 TaxID=3231908 RepID=UPI00345692FF